MDELEPIGEEVKRQLEKMSEEELRFLVIDMQEKLGILFGAVSRLAANNPEVQSLLHPRREEP